MNLDDEILRAVFGASDGGVASTVANTGAFTYSDLRKVMEALNGGPLHDHGAPLSFAGMPVVENRHLPVRKRIEHYRGRGGYKCRWSIAMTREIEEPYVLILGGRTLVTLPAYSAMLRNAIP